MSVEVTRTLLLGSGLSVLVALALSESFALLPGAVAAYAAAWWVLVLEQRMSTRSGDPR